MSCIDSRRRTKSFLTRFFPEAAGRGKREGAPLAARRARSPRPSPAGPAPPSPSSGVPSASEAPYCGRARPPVRLLGAARRGVRGFARRGGRPARPAAADGRAVGRRVRAGAARWPAPLPASAGGDVVMRWLRPCGCPSAAASRRPDGAAARAAVRRCHRAGLRLPRRPQSHLQVMAGGRLRGSGRGPGGPGVRGAWPREAAARRSSWRWCVPRRPGTEPPAGVPSRGLRVCRGGRPGLAGRGSSRGATPCARTSPCSLWSGSVRRRAGQGRVRNGRSGVGDRHLPPGPNDMRSPWQRRTFSCCGGIPSPAQRCGGDTGPSDPLRAGASGARGGGPRSPH